MGTIQVTGQLADRWSPRIVIIIGALAAMLLFVVKDPPREQVSITQPIRTPVE